MNSRARMIAAEQKAESCLSKTNLPGAIRQKMHRFSGDGFGMCRYMLRMRISRNDTSIAI